MRLVTFNILHGRSLGDRRVDVGRLAEAIRRLDPDVLALQEVDRNQERSARVDLTALAAEAMGAVAHRFVPTLSGTPGEQWEAITGDEPPDSVAYGIALLSRIPVQDWRVLTLPAMSRRVPMPLPRRPFRPVLVHDEPRVALAARLELRGRVCIVVNTHLTFLPWWNGRQLRHLVRDLAGADHPLVLMGDLNMDAQRAARHSGLRSLVSAPTYPARRPRRQIDHILTDAPVRADALTGASVLLDLSDHRALAVQMQDGVWDAP